MAIWTGLTAAAKAVAKVDLEASVLKVILLSLVAFLFMGQKGFAAGSETLDALLKRQENLRSKYEVLFDSVFNEVGRTNENVEAVRSLKEAIDKKFDRDAGIEAKVLRFPKVMGSVQPRDLENEPVKILLPTHFMDFACSHFYVNTIVEDDNTMEPLSPDLEVTLDKDHVRALLGGLTGKPLTFMCQFDDLAVKYRIPSPIPYSSAHVDIHWSWEASDRLGQNAVKQAQSECLVSLDKTWSIVGIEGLAYRTYAGGSRFYVPKIEDALNTAITQFSSSPCILREVAHVLERDNI